MSAAGSAYGLWPLVAVNAAIFILFAFGFTRPRTRTDWRSLGAFSAFVVALFTEMYGFPLTLYLLSGWLTGLYPDLDLFGHNSGHLWSTLFDLKGDPHFSVFHLISYVLIGRGLVLLWMSWRVLHAAQRKGTLATTGPYAYVRHPQYLAFIHVLLGFLLQWPTLPTLVMFPVLVVMYVRLARAEERRACVQFGEVYVAYMADVPAFMPRLRRPGHRGRSESPR
ncbi:MAG: isoprenylcysteine carboxylmethyltransferase family protein [Proteobacteria bacterium]|nr:isoprenylcysteine carboxylmethyltransferase family protein [Pseudomonadota bacterium]